MCKVNQEMPKIFCTCDGEPEVVPPAPLPFHQGTFIEKFAKHVVMGTTEVQANDRSQAAIWKDPRLRGR